MRPKRYRLYLDESGDHSYGQLDEPAHRYLALLAVWFEQPADEHFRQSLQSLKRRIFGARGDSLYFHREEIINRRGLFAVLRDPSIQSHFDNGLLDIVRNAEFRLACVVIDKQFHQQQ